MSDTYDYTQSVQQFVSQNEKTKWQDTVGRAHCKSVYSSRCKNGDGEIAYLMWIAGNDDSGVGGVTGEPGLKFYFRILTDQGISEAQAQRYLDQATATEGGDDGDAATLKFASQLALENMCSGLRTTDVQEELDKKYKADFIDFVTEEVASDLTPLLIKQTEDTIECVTASATIIDEIIKMIDEQFYAKILPAFGAQSAAKRLVNNEGRQSPGKTGFQVNRLFHNAGVAPPDYSMTTVTYVGAVRDQERGAGANYDHVVALIEQTDDGPYPYDHFQNANMLNSVLQDPNKEYSLYWLSLMTAVSNEIYDICTKLKTDFETTSAPTEEDPEPNNNLAKLQAGDDEAFNRYSDAFTSGTTVRNADNSVFGLSYTGANGLYEMLNSSSRTSPQNAANPVGIVEQIKSVETAAYAAAKIIEKSNPDLAQLIVKYVGLLNVQVSQLKDKADCVNEVKGDVRKARGKALFALNEAKNNATATGTPLYIDDDDIAVALAIARNNIRFQNLNDLRLSVSPKNKRTFKEQCFLLAFAAKFAAYKKYTLDSALQSQPQDSQKTGV